MNWLRRLMYGRYGNDELGLFLLILGIVTAMLSALSGIYLIHVISLLAYFFCLYRMFSKNYARRRKENRIFLERSQPMRKWLKLQQKKFADRKTHRYFACPKCKQQVRVPKGKGKIRIICPKCREEFIRKS